MKKLNVLVIILLSAVLSGGCSGKFSPDQTTVRVEKDGSVTAAIIDELNQNYYEEEELKETANQAVDDYNSGKDEDAVVIQTFKAEERKVTLVMKYASSKDYELFNNVVFFTGDIVEADQAGYLFDTSFHAVEKGQAAEETVDKKEAAGENYNVLILEEHMDVEVPGNILYVSSNVEVLGKRKAKTGNSETKSESETETESETGTETESGSEKNGEPGTESIAPEEEGGQEEEDTGAGIAYIIYK